MTSSHLDLSENFDCLFSMNVDKVLYRMMDDIVNLGECSHCLFTQVPIDVDYGFGLEFWTTKHQLPMHRPLQDKVDVLGVDQIQHGHHHLHCNHKLHFPTRFEGPTRPRRRYLFSLAKSVLSGTEGTIEINLLFVKFTYGIIVQKLVLEGCIDVVGVWFKDAGQVTNKWDGLINNYRKFKEQIRMIGSANWWRMRRKEKNLPKTRKMLLEFSESMYIELEDLIGRR